jgi:hypothetical protein
VLRDHRVGLCLAFALTACRAPVTEPAATPGAEVAAAPRDATVTTPADAVMPDAVPPDAAPPDAAPDPLTAIEAWGVEVAVPTTAAQRHDARNDAHRIELAYDEIVVLSRHARAAPASLDAARKTLGTQRKVVEHAAGTTADGVGYVMRTFEVRTGMPGELPGETLHYYIPITRVFAWLPLDARHHVQCTGYLEYRVKSVTSAALQRLARVCLSMRVAP